MIQIPKDTEHYRQGDLMFYKLFDMPAEVKIQKSRPGLILEGEGTGHHHTRKSQGQVLLLDPGKEKPGHHALLKLEEPDEIVHQEHNSIRLGTGVWLVVRQRQLNAAISD